MGSRWRPVPGSSARSRPAGSPGEEAAAPSDSPAPRISTSLRAAAAWSRPDGPMPDGACEAYAASTPHGPPARAHFLPRPERGAPIDHAHPLARGPEHDFTALAHRVSADLQRHRPREAHSHPGREPFVDARDRKAAPDPARVQQRIEHVPAVDPHVDEAGFEAGTREGPDAVSPLAHAGGGSDADRPLGQLL